MILCSIGGDLIRPWIGLAHDPQLRSPAARQRQGGLKVESLFRRYWLTGHFPILKPRHIGKQFTQPMRQRLLQGRAFQFSSVHGNSCFHDAVNIACIVNMLKRYFPLFLTPGK